ncbi:hypothetical protein D3C78_1573490 [compost metagenome]
MPTSTRSPGTSTLRPISAEACRVCPASICPVMPCRVSFSSSMPLSVLTWANCEVISAFSIGLSGSWFCSCVTSRVMKLERRSSAFCFSLAVVDAPPLIALMTEVSIVVVMAVLLSYRPASRS